jgi:hypothetical protein
VVEEVVQGNHRTYLSATVEETAAKVRRHLRRAQGPANGQPPG